jgi:hypothetical protein
MAYFFNYLLASFFIKQQSKAENCRELAQHGVPSLAGGECPGRVIYTVFYSKNVYLFILIILYFALYIIQHSRGVFLKNSPETIVFPVQKIL